jgi:hypothetical protein
LNGVLDSFPSTTLQHHINNQLPPNPNTKLTSTKTTSAMAASTKISGTGRVDVSLFTDLANHLLLADQYHRRIITFFPLQFLILHLNLLANKEIKNSNSHLL